MSLLNDILDLSRIEAGKLELGDQEEIDVAELLDDCVQHFREAAYVGDVGIGKDYPSDLPALMGDRRACKQVLFNLLSNAVKFTPQGGRVDVSGGAYNQDGGLDLIVADTGIGIPEDQIEKAMKPFERVENDIVRNAEGTGLGLPIVKSLVGLQGGSLLLESVLGTGHHRDGVISRGALGVVKGGERAVVRRLADSFLWLPRRAGCMKQPMAR